MQTDQSSIAFAFLFSEPDCCVDSEKEILPKAVTKHTTEIQLQRKTGSFFTAITQRLKRNKDIEDKQPKCRGCVGLRRHRLRLEGDLFSGPSCSSSTCLLFIRLRNSESTWSLSTQSSRRLPTTTVAYNKNKWSWLGKNPPPCRVVLILSKETFNIRARAMVRRRSHPHPPPPPLPPRNQRQ